MGRGTGLSLLDEIGGDMSAISVITNVLSSMAHGPLNPDLVHVAGRGASSAEIQNAELMLSRGLSEAHAKILGRWNGLNLDMIRLYGVGDVEPGIRSLVSAQSVSVERPAAWLIIGSDPAGMVYAEDADGAIYCSETDGSAAPERVAVGIDDFFERYVFGLDSDKFAGEEWKAKLVASGLLK